MALVRVLKRNLREALTQRRLKDAEDLIERLKKEDPLGRETRGLELEFYIDAARFAEAEALSQQLCQLFPQSGRILFLAGKLAYREKHFDEAEAHFRESQRIYPHSATQRWLGKTLTQLGKFDEAESLLLAVLEYDRNALLDLGWLYERKNDWQAGLKAYDEFLSEHPGNRYAMDSRSRLKSKTVDPEVLIEEVSALAELGEEVSSTLFPEYVSKLFVTGLGPRARDEISSRIGKIDAREAVQLAWTCYRHQAYDLACTLFLASLPSNHTNYKHLSALESAARKCNRLAEVASAYRALLPKARHLYGRYRSLSRGLR